MGNDQNEKRRRNCFVWAKVHPNPMSIEQEQLKQKMWANTLSDLIKSMGGVSTATFLPASIFTYHNGLFIQQNGESSSSNELQNEENLNVIEEQKDQALLIDDKEDEEVEKEDEGKNIEEEIKEVEEDDDDNELPELFEVSKNNNIISNPPIQDKEGYLICKMGDFITDRFKIIKQLGDGVFAHVYLVEDLQNNSNNTTTIKKFGEKNKNQVKKAIKIVRNTKAYKEAALHEINVLESLYSSDEQNDNNEMIPKHLVIKLLEHFDYFDHICLVFEPYGKSIYDFLGGNDFHPYPIDQIRYIAYQLILAVKFVHDRRLVHTDLKPENILFVDSDNFDLKYRWDKPYEEMRIGKSKRKRIRVLKDASIRLIDFGSAVFEYDHHEDTITTRHYRAPEVILKNGWSSPCDVWSIGCILFELYSGCPLFPKMDDIQHMATIERVIGAVPKTMKQASSTGLYKNNNQLNCTQKIRQMIKVRSRKLLEYIKISEVEHEQFFDLLENMLVIDPDLRINLEIAREHEFFENLSIELRLKAENGTIKNDKNIGEENLKN